VKPLLAALLGLALPALSQELSEDIVVTATREPEPAAKVPAPVTSVPGAEIGRAKSLDEALRRDPSFAVFRRS
jgi:outer membrane cobalamin receptor